MVIDLALMSLGLSPTPCLLLDRYLPSSRQHTDRFEGHRNATRSHQPDQNEFPASSRAVSGAAVQQYIAETSPSKDDNEEDDQHSATEGQMAEGSDHQEDDQYDLFASVFGQKLGPADEDVDMDEVSRLRTASYTFQDCTHDSSIQVRGASTPPPETTASIKALEQETSKTAPREHTVEVQDPKYPHSYKSLSVPLVQHQKLHIRCFQLIPRLPLALHRYWIAVIEPTRHPENVRKENHLTWMKGNRFTTVKTVGHYFHQANLLAEEFVLLHAGRRVAEDVMVQELDLWDDKFVLFRAVKAHSAAAKGREVAQGLVVEVITLD